ncbi:hypothetical protein [Streptomyces sclerotialus]|uniref:hypothetical protein n=1 Tax=Streptomyces sclerotialus TaxID=1957 RepID=UPI0004CBE47A
MGPPPKGKGPGSGAIVALVPGALCVASVAVRGVFQTGAPFARGSYGPRYAPAVPGTLDGGAYSLDAGPGSVGLQAFAPKAGRVRDEVRVEAD